MNNNINFNTDGFNERSIYIHNENDKNRKLKNQDNPSNKVKTPNNLETNKNNIGITNNNLGIIKTRLNLMRNNFKK